jgi:pyruvate/2-oxoglutarate dehydrogenase complex dihydrolipoamide acyltransferase (E2) component
MFASKLIIRALLVLMLFSTTSCIDLLHEIKINADQSGQAFIGIEATTLGMLANLDPALIDEKIKQNVIDFPLKSAAKLARVKGISNIKALGRIEKGRIGIQFDFVDEKALNDAYYALADQEKKAIYPKIVKISNHRVKVRNMTPIIKRYLEKNQNAFLDNELIKYFRYRTVIEVPSVVKIASIKQGNVGGNGSLLELNVPMNKLLTQKQNSGTKFRY